VSPVLAESSAASITSVDFRRPSRIGRDAVVALETTHEAFVRRLSTAWSSGSFAAIEIEHVATDQLSIDDFVRSLPVPTALSTLRVGALGAHAFLQVDLPFALLFVERLLGGPGDPAISAIARRPTELETALLTHELLGPAVTAVDEALKDLSDEPSNLVSLETTPQPLQLGSPGELLLLLTYRVELRGEMPAQGMLTLAYPVAPLVVHLDRLVLGSNPVDEDESVAARSVMSAALLATEVDVCVRLGDSGIGAAALAGLTPGDVLRLDHPVDRPAELVCDERPIGTAHLGKRGRRLAVQVVASPSTTRD
jgi:flagellar motor switch protein FliM